MRTIAVVNQKGGCGKTTVSINLASALAESGKKTLLVDMDSQSHCAVGLAVPEEQIEQSIYDVLISKSRNEPVKLAEILWQIADNLELAPSSIDLSAFEQQMSGVTKRESCLKNVLSDVKNAFDYVIVDCPPAVGLLTFNALMAATDVIVPVETGYFALHGLSKQLETLGILCQRANHTVNVRVLASMYDIRTKMAREIMAELKGHFAEKMFGTIINFNTKLKEAASFGQPIGEYDNTSKGQVDFSSLAEEIIESEIKHQKRSLVNSLAAQLESISSSADELLRSAKVSAQPAAQAGALGLVEQTEKDVETEKIKISAAARVKHEKPKATLDKKLSDYYGVSQAGDAVVFVSLYPKASSVKIAGDFNGWQPYKTELKKVGSSDVWQTKVKLPAGRYRYRLVVDGQWQHDQNNPLTEPNPFGQLNSVLEVK